MKLTGLENDYYLAGNEIYVTVSETATPSRFLDVTYTNITTGSILGTLRPYPNLQDVYRFNVSLPARALFPEPSRIDQPNSIQVIKIDIIAYLENGNVENLSITKRFVRGGRDKHKATEWHLEDGAELNFGPFPKFMGIPEFTAGLFKISGDKLVEYVPKERQDIWLKDRCNPTYVRFLNSLGGYQWWVFEQRIDNEEGKAGKTKTSPAYALKQDSVRQLVTSQSREFTLLSDMSIEFYDVAVELISSTDIYIYYPDAPKDDYDAKFERVFLNGTNKVEKNTVSRKIDFKLNLYSPSYITKEI